MARKELGRKALDTLSSTGRKYLDGTHRARLQSPGIERYPAERRGGTARAVLVAVALVAALLGVMLWYTGGR
jgi:hypothetical protein